MLLVLILPTHIYGGTEKIHALVVFCDFCCQFTYDIKNCRSRFSLDSLTDSNMASSSLIRLRWLFPPSRRSPIWDMGNSYVRSSSMPQRYEYFLDYTIFRCLIMVINTVYTQLSNFIHAHTVDYKTLSNINHIQLTIGNNGRIHRLQALWIFRVQDVSHREHRNHVHNAATWPPCDSSPYTHVASLGSMDNSVRMYSHRRNIPIRMSTLPLNR